MHKFIKQWRQEPPWKLCKLCDFTYLTNGGPRVHKNAKHSGLEGPKEFKCALCDYTASINYNFSKHRFSEHGFPNKINEKALLQCEECKFSFT